MGLGFHDWAVNEVVTAANMDGYLQDQVTMVFATEAARDAALTTRKANGMMTTQTDTGQVTRYNGSAWRVIYRPATAWTPTLNGITLGNGAVGGYYSRSGELVTIHVGYQHGSTSVVGGTVSTNLPVAASAVIDCHGSGVANDSGTNRYVLSVAIDPTSQTAGLISTVGNGLVAAGQPFTWGNGDRFNFTATYIAA